MTFSSVQTTRRRFLSAAVAGTILAGAVAGTATSAEAAAGSDTLFANESLGVNQSIVSGGGAYKALLQSDGNFVVYGPSGAAWASNTVGSGATRVTMQGDGNLVMYTASGTPVFATGTNGTGGNRLVMQSDGNLVEYGGVAVWASKNSSERAISWMYGKIGSTAYEGYCERAVENAFGTGGRYASAKANWNARSKRTPYSAAPRGALVFYNTSANGHVAISLGNGKVISTSAGGKVGIVPIGYFQNPLGWAWAPW